MLAHFLLCSAGTEGALLSGLGRGHPPGLGYSCPIPHWDWVEGPGLGLGAAPTGCQLSVGWLCPRSQDCPMINPNHQLIVGIGCGAALGTPSAGSCVIGIKGILHPSQKK